MHEEYQAYGSPTVKLIEEFSEVTKLLCKGERFGYDDHHPDLPVTETNRKLIAEEISDVRIALDVFERWLTDLPHDLRRR
jgi:hypothetical protein